MGSFLPTLQDLIDASSSTATHPTIQSMTEEDLNQATFNLSAVFNNLAFALLELGLVQEAAETFLKGVAKNPKNSSKFRCDIWFC